MNSWLISFNMILIFQIQLKYTNNINKSITGLAVKSFTVNKIKQINFSTEKYNALGQRSRKFLKLKFSNFSSSREYIHMNPL